MLNLKMSDGFLGSQNFAHKLTFLFFLHDLLWRFLTGSEMIIILLIYPF